MFLWSNDGLLGAASTPIGVLEIAKVSKGLKGRRARREGGSGTEDRERVDVVAGIVARLVPDTLNSVLLPSTNPVLRGFVRSENGQLSATGPEAEGPSVGEIGDPQLSRCVDFGHPQRAEKFTLQNHQTLEAQLFGQSGDWIGGRVTGAVLGVRAVEPSTRKRGVTVGEEPAVIAPLFGVRAEQPSAFWERAAGKCAEVNTVGRRWQRPLARQKIVACRVRDASLTQDDHLRA